MFDCSAKGAVHEATPANLASFLNSVRVRSNRKAPLARGSCPRLVVMRVVPTYRTRSLGISSIAHVSRIMHRCILSVQRQDRNVEKGAHVLDPRSTPFLHRRARNARNAPADVGGFQLNKQCRVALIVVASVYCSQVRSHASRRQSSSPPRKLITTSFSTR